MSVTVPNRMRRFERLVEVCRLLSQAKALDEMLQTIVTIASELTLSEACSIYIFEEETGLLKFIAAPAGQLETLKRIRVPLENSVAGKCFTTSQLVLIQNAHQDERIFRVVDHTLEFKTTSLLAVPLVYREKTIGVFEALNKAGASDYNEDDIVILETLASQAAVGIQNTHLLQNAQRAYNELAELDRMKSDFIAISSHELRTPLGLILGHATVLRELVKEATQIRQVEVIVKSAERLRKIIENLENAEKVQSGKSLVSSNRFDLNGLIGEIVGSFRQEAVRKQIGLKCSLPEKHILVEGDAEKIAIAVGNLIENAITFTNEKGRVVVTAENLLGYAKVSVQDNGIGIPAKDINRVFDRFFQVETHMTRKHGGIGIGLSVAKVMIELHGGQIWVESVEGEGSTFSFLLPSGVGTPDGTPAVFDTTGR
jgi:signal transduction histidine kinase